MYSLPPSGYFQLIGSKGDREWPIGEPQGCLQNAIGLAEDERCIGEEIKIIDSEGTTVYPS